MVAKRSLIAAVAFILLLAVPATADDTETRIVAKSWEVTLNEDDSTTRSVAPGGTFSHCPGDIVTTIAFRGKMTHPSRRGVEYDVDFKHRGQYQGGIYGGTTRKHGKIYESYGTEGHQGMGNGKWTFAFARNGKPIGAPSIRVRPRSGAAC